MKALPSDEWHEDLGASIFICFSRDEDGEILGEPPELYYGSGYLEDDFDFDKWTHFIDGDFNFVFEDADPINFPSKRNSLFNMEDKPSVNKIKVEGIEEAIAATRESMNEGCNKWLCRVVDLQVYANKLKGESDEK